MRARDLVKQGINPAHERQRARLRRDQDGATTFESVTREWLAMKDWEEITKARRLNMLQRVVFGKIGTLPVKQITPMHILDVLTTAARKNGPSVAAGARRSMAGVFELAMATLRVDRDPVHPVRRALPPNISTCSPGATTAASRWRSPRSGRRCMCWAGAASTACMTDVG
jgi:integrase